MAANDVNKIRADHEAITFKSHHKARHGFYCVLWCVI